MLLIIIAGGAVRERARSASRRFDLAEAGKLAIATSRLHLLEAAVANREESVKIAQTDALAMLAEMARQQDARMVVAEAERGSARSTWQILLATMVLGVVAFVVVVMRRLDARRRELAAQAGLLSSVIESVGDALVAVDAERRVVVSNAAARRAFSHVSVGATLSKSSRLLTETGHPLRPSQAPIARALAGEPTNDRQLRLGRGRDTLWLGATGRPVRDAAGAVIGGVCVYRDVSERRRHAHELESLSVTDELTGLYNRRGFMLLAEQHVRMAERTKTPFALLFGDLDHLKAINDTMGHEAGDRAIRTAAHVLKRTLRGCDILARLGGDEFVALVAAPTPGAVRAVVRRIAEALEAHGAAAGEDALSLSLGEAMFDPHAPIPLRDLLADADARMYENKARRRPRTDLRLVRSA